MYQAFAAYYATGTLETSTPYYEQFVDALKLHVPASHRRWSMDTKTWLVEPPYDTTAITLLRRFFPNAGIGKKAGSQPSRAERRRCACDDDHKALYVCQGAPAEVIQAAYRALVKIHHPDRGGDTSAMQRLNAAYARLESGARS